MKSPKKLNREQQLRITYTPHKRSDHPRRRKGDECLLRFNVGSSVPIRYKLSHVAFREYKMQKRIKVAALSR